jgi:hypothetical protein
MHGKGFVVRFLPFAVRQDRVSRSAYTIQGVAYLLTKYNLFIEKKNKKIITELSDPVSKFYFLR